MANNTGGTVALNNYLQEQGKLTSLSWEDSPTGPRHAAEWTSKCKINGEVVATGTGNSKNAARDAAADAALPILQGGGNTI
ncbi:hypothetical protein C8Q79DRAFT_1005546 [Trametes meyenii]|nr:hypothetical protein C8Q79DRAFT_1005546 [Trametes meyenii]